MLTQTEADSLIAMNKSFAQPATIELPPGSDDTYELVGSDPKELFLLDLWRGTLKLSKLKFQNRARKAFVLVRLDIDGAPHTNPDGVRVGGTHIHVYREGFEDKWAQPLDPAQFRALGDRGLTFTDFCRYCNIVNAPPFQGGIL